MHDVVIVGSINMDLSAVVNRIPAPGETVLATGLVRSPGGKGANQAVAAARAGGASVAFVGAVGDDADGRTLIKHLQANGIATAGIDTISEPTGTALISVDAQGENAIVVVPGANMALGEPNEAQSSTIREASIVLSQLEIPLATVTRAAHLTHEGGGRFILNAAPAQPLPSDLLSLVDVLIVNEHEAREVTQEQDLDRALEQLAQSVPAVVMTLGGAGSRVLLRDQSTVAVPAYRVEVVDTTAAGDTFCGVLSAALSRDAGWENGLHDASAAAALTVTRRGAQDSIPTAAELARMSAGETVR